MKIVERLAQIDDTPAPLPMTFMDALRGECWCQWEHDTRENGEQLSFEDYFVEWCDARHADELCENAPPCECEPIDERDIPY